ncbi:hypothetical protein [Sulfurirhabdus autotrophica]|uniref:Uncharacterized protein n=1 Tax=Sulfurirhabdus autotrophica TaxID=1706046 RepID=A0A4R3XW77_9PROT|nr:hypothetical protein [Sulfurirhabdus autotrophica]TCV83262.1 hypothetical protein EDC63_11612 [Sulfurirhabdus autotrophica]
MQLAGLSLDQAPPLSVPFRFFLSAPLFMLLAAILLLSAGPDALITRWSPAMLAVTHMLTLGFMTMVMMGAMLQMLPVVAGSPVLKPRLIALLVHLPLTTGALLLSAGFFLGQNALIRLAIPVLIAGFVVFLVATGASLIRATARNSTVNAMRLAIISLAVTVALGVLLAAALSGYADVSILKLTSLHATWGLLGWLGLLVISVAYQVVPMFQLTPVYPKQVSRWLAWAMFILVIFWSGSIFQQNEITWVSTALLSCLAGGLTVFAVTTIYLQQKRRRRIPDVTLQFWRFGLASLLVSITLWAAGRFMPSIQTSAVYPVLLGILFIMGFAASIITGMLYKIVPYLVWFHLHAQRNRGGGVPNMKEIIPDVFGWIQLNLHIFSSVFLLFAVIWPTVWMTVIASCTLAASSALLWINLFRAGRLYMKYAKMRS